MNGDKQDLQRCLATEERVRYYAGVSGRWTYKTDEVCAPIQPYILPQLSTRHPFRDELKGIERGTPEGTIFGWSRRFHTGLPPCRTSFGFCQGMAIRPKVEQIRYPFNLFLIPLVEIEVFLTQTSSLSNPFRCH
jgi:hypothetical protein